MERGLLGERNFSLLVGAVGLSALGDWLAVVPLALHLEEATSSGLVLAALFIALWAPVVVLAGPAGLVVDRFDRSRVLLTVSILQAVVAVALAFVEATMPILVLTALLGAGFAFAQPAEFALIPAVAGAARVRQANGYVETSRYVGFTLGPLLGGVLAAGGGLRVALVVNAATFVVVAGAALALRSVSKTPARRADEEQPRRAREGFASLVSEPGLAIVMAVAFVSLLFMTASAPAEVFFAKDFLDAGDAGYGALISSWTLAMALGSLVIARRVPVASLATVALAAMVVQGAGLAIPTLWLVFVFALGGYFVGGLAHGTKNVLVRTLVHQRVPERLHGRAFAAYNALRNGAELVALAGGGLLIAALGARWTLFLAGAIPIAAALGALVVARRTLAEEGKRLVPSEAP